MTSNEINFMNNVEISTIEGSAIVLAKQSICMPEKKIWIPDHNEGKSIIICENSRIDGIVF